MKATLEIKAQSGWQVLTTVATVKVRDTLDAAVSKSHTELARLLTGNSLDARKFRVLITEKKQVLVLVSFRKTRADEYPTEQAAINKAYDDRIKQFLAPRNDEYRTSQVSGGMRLTNTYNMRPGFGTTHGRAHVIHNAKGSNLKAKSSGRKKAITEGNGIGSTGQFSARNLSLNDLPNLTKTEPAERLDRHLQKLADNRTAQIEALHKLRHLKG